MWVKFQGFKLTLISLSYDQSMRIHFNNTALYKFFILWTKKMGLRYAEKFPVDVLKA